MRFKDLVAECAYSFEHLHLDESAFNNGGLTAIIGKNKDQDTANGAGKSNILKIIYYLLFGQELNKESIEEISNRVMGRGHFGQLVFEDKGNEFKIQRFRDFRPSKKSILQAKEGSKAKLKGIRFFINGEIFGDKKPNGEPTSDTEIQNIILNRIGITPELFLMSVMTAQDSKMNFLMAADTKKKEIISELLDLEVYESAYSAVKEDIEGKERQIGQAEMQIEEIGREDVTKDEELKSLKIKEGAFQSAIEKEVGEVQTRFLKAEAEYRSLKKNKPQVQDPSKIEELLKTKEAELEALPKDSTSLETEEIAVLTEQAADCDSMLRLIEGDASRITGQITFIKGEIKKKSLDKELLKSQIILVKALIPANVKGDELETLTSEIQNASQLAQDLELQLGRASQEAQGLESNLARLNGQLQLLTADFSKKGSSQEALVSQISELSKVVVDSEKLPKDSASLNSIIEDSSARALSLNKRKNEIEFKIAQINAEKTALVSSEDCPTCNRPWDEAHQAERDEKVHLLTRTVDLLTAEALVVLGSINEAEITKRSASALIRLLALQSELASVKTAEDQIADLSHQEAALAGDLNRAREVASKLTDSRAKTIAYIQDESKKLDSYKHISSNQTKLSQLESDLKGLEEAEEQVESLTKITQDLEKRAAKVRAVANALVKRRTEEMDRIRTQMRANQETMAKLNFEIKTLSSQLSQARLAEQAVKQWESSVASAYEKLESLLKQVEQIQARPNPFKDLMEKVEERKEELKARKENVRSRIEKIQDELQYLYFWKNGFGPTGIRSFISDEVVVHLNEIVRDYLNDLFDGAISVVFESESISQKGGVSNKISTKFYLNGKESPIGLLSGGERQRVVLAVDLALSDIAESRTGTKINLKFLDEPFNGIDGNGQLKSIALFSKIANRKQGFFIITHDEKFQALCQNTIFVVKENEISKLVSKDKFRDA